MRLAILSDTHGLLRPQVLERLQGADAILHAGDMDRPGILERLEAVAPVYAVRGNNDRWAPFLPRELRVTLGGATFYLVHNRLDVPMDLTGVNVVVYGHSHRYVQQEEGGVLWLNPGSCGPRRFRQEITMAEAVVTDGRVLVGKITLPEGE